MRAKTLLDIREHLAMGGKVSYRDEEWDEHTEEVVKWMVYRNDCGIIPSRWELLPIEEETPEERQALIKKAERDFPMDFEETWKWAREKQFAHQLLATLKQLTETSMEAYTAQHKPEDEWDEYDYMMLPQWKAAIELIKEIGS